MPNHCSKGQDYILNGTIKPFLLDGDRSFWPFLLDGTFLFGRSVWTVPFLLAGSLFIVPLLMGKHFPISSNGRLHYSRIFPSTLSKSVSSGLPISISICNTTTSRQVWKKKFPSEVIFWPGKLKQIPTRERCDRR